MTQALYTAILAFSVSMGLDHTRVVRRASVQLLIIIIIIILVLVLYDLGEGIPFFIIDV